MSGNFGMMNEAYFVSKTTLIDWVNSFLGVRLERVEDCATGAVYCNIWDALHPGTLKMSKVDFTVRADHEYIKNWKLLQEAFQRAQVQKFIPVERLIKARYQDNLEFLQWMYKYAHDSYSGDPEDPDYDALERRGKSKGGSSFVGPIRAGSGRARAARNPAPRTRGRGKENTTSRPSSAVRNKSSSSIPRQANAGAARKVEQLRNENEELRGLAEGLETKLAQLQREHEELSSVAKEIEQERDFYFNKVLEVERICKGHDDQDMPLLQSVYNLLYQDQDGSKEASADVNTTDPIVDDF